MRRTAIALLPILFGLGCAGSGNDRGPTPSWTIEAAGSKGAPSLGTLYDAGTLTPGQTIPAIPFLAVSMNGFNQSLKLADVSSDSAGHVAAVPSVSSVNPTPSGAAFSISLAIPANYPYAGSGSEFSASDPSGTVKTAGISFKVRTVQGTAAKESFKTTADSGTVPVTITPINGFTGQISFAFDRTFQASDGIANTYSPLPSGVNISASADVTGASAVTANAALTWTSVSAGSYAIVAILKNGTMAIRVPIELTMTTGSTGGTVSFNPPVTVTAGSKSFGFFNAVSPGGKIVGADNGGFPLYWASPTVAPVSVTLAPGGAGEMTGINDSGAMIGTSGGNGYYWSSATATPIELKIPTNYANGQPFGINASGVIVGSMNNASSIPVACYWSSPTATATPLKNMSAGPSIAQSFGFGISNSGVIVGDVYFTSAPAQLWVWSSGTATPTALSPTTVSYTFGSMNPITGGICASTLTDDPSTTFPHSWSPSSYSPNSFQGTGIASAMDSNGVVFGSNTGKSTALVWTSPGAQPVPLTSLCTSAAGWTFSQALFVTSAGDVIGYGSHNGTVVPFVAKRN